MPVTTRDIYMVNIVYGNRGPGLQEPIQTPQSLEVRWNEITDVVERPFFLFVHAVNIAIEGTTSGSTSLIYITGLPEMKCATGYGRIDQRSSPRRTSLQRPMCCRTTHSGNQLGGSTALVYAMREYSGKM